MRALQWLWNMRLLIGLQAAYAVVDILLYLGAVWLIVAIVNWVRDRDERRNVGIKERRIIDRYKANATYWHRRCLDAEALAGDRLAEMRAAGMEIDQARKTLAMAWVQLRGTKEK